MLPENRSFHIRGDDGEEYGPVGLDELREWMRENRVGLGTTVRLDEPGTLWQPWQYHPELVALLAEVRVMSPVPGQPGLVIAPLGRRLLAGVMDLLLSLIISFSCFTLVAMAVVPLDLLMQLSVTMSHQPVGPLELPTSILFFRDGIVYGVLIAYLTTFHTLYGQTPAKDVLKLRVVDEQGRKPTVIKALVRSSMVIFSMALFFLPMTYAFFNPQRRTFHDFVAGTYVVEV